MLQLAKRGNDHRRYPKTGKGIFKINLLKTSMKGGFLVTKGKVNTMDKYLGILYACIIGISLGLQPTINSTLGKKLTPQIAALHSILITLIIILIVAISSKNLIIYRNILDIHPIYWTGGIFGACIVLLSIITVPILGATNSIAIFVTVQLITSAILDHYGLLGLAVAPITPVKILGIITLLIGVKLVLS